MYARILEEALKEVLDRGSGRKETLSGLALVTYQCYTYHPNVYGYLLKTESVYPRLKGEYFFCIFSRRYGKEALYVSEETFRKKEDCVEQCIYYLRHFALYSQLSRLQLAQK